MDSATYCVRRHGPLSAAVARCRSPMAVDRRARGNVAEEAARTELKRAGLRDVAANAHYRGGELDLVMDDAGTLVFVEVRYRRWRAFGGGAASVDTRKRRKLVLAAQLFLAGHHQ